MIDVVVALVNLRGGAEGELFPTSDGVEVASLVNITGTPASVLELEKKVGWGRGN